MIGKSISLSLSIGVVLIILCNDHYVYSKITENNSNTLNQTTSRLSQLSNNNLSTLFEDKVNLSNNETNINEIINSKNETKTDQTTLENKITKSDNWNNYSSNKLGFTVYYPNNITIQKEEPETRFDLDKDLEIGDLNRDGFSITPQALLVYKKDIKDVANLYRNVSLQFNLPNGFPILIDDVTKMNIKGDSGYSYLISLIDNESRKSVFVSNTTIMEHNDIVYRFLFVTNTSQYEYSKSIFNNVLKSLKWFDDKDLVAIALSINQTEQMLRERNNVATIETSLGPIKIELFSDVAPNHVANFKDLASKGFYDGVIFHRIVPGFVIQAGDPNTKYDIIDRELWGSGGPGYTINQEFNDIPHERGILSMARTMDPDSAGSQFFIVLNNSKFLDKQYTVFGKVIEGMDVVDQIANLTTNSMDQPIIKDLAKINSIKMN